jgi:hypothetical protein
MLKTLPLRLQESQQEKWSYSEFLNGLLVDEIRYRDQKSSEGRLKRAKFRTQADFDHFDFTLKRSLTKTQIKELKELSFMKSKQNLLLLGPTGVGKTFFATAIGHQACVEGYNVIFEGMNSLIETIKFHRVAGTFLRIRKRLIEADLLIIDDDGLKARVVDYKTGNDKYPDRDQLTLMSLMVFAHFPHIRQVSSALLFVVKNSMVTQTMTVEEKDFNWWRYRERVAKLAASYDNDVWNPTSTPLCGWCPVKSCEFNPKH